MGKGVYHGAERRGLTSGTTSGHPHSAPLQPSLLLSLAGSQANAPCGDASPARSRHALWHAYDMHAVAVAISSSHLASPCLHLWVCVSILLLALLLESSSPRQLTEPCIMCSMKCLSGAPFSLLYRGIISYHKVASLIVTTSDATVGISTEGGQ